jgi:hypothetical protein
MMYHPLPLCQVMATTATTAPSGSRVMIGNCNPGPSRTFECCITRSRGGSVGVGVGVDVGEGGFVGVRVAGNTPSGTVGVARTVTVGVGNGAGSALLAWRTKAKRNIPRPTKNRADTNAPAISNTEGRRCSACGS